MRRTRFTFRRRHASGAATLMCALACAACGGSQVDAATLLHQAKQTVDNAPSAHFQLTSSQLQGSGPYITGGTGDMKRPDGFRGSLDVTLSGFSISISVVSVNNTFYVKLPTSSSYQVTDPSSYGFGNPAQLLDPSRGLSSLLTTCSKPTLRQDDRYNGESLHEVSCSLPGTAIKQLLTDAAPSQPVAATFGIASDSSQLRRVVLTGPFFSATANSTFTVILDSYGENVSITPPAAASS